MNIREIIPGIDYVGVNDRVTEKFEGQWPLPYGVSYNSYIVRGSKATALMDTALIDEVRQYLNAVDQTVGTDAKVDYLVVHHMEPDHSGSIRQVLDRFPLIKIVGNRQTIDMIRGFYKVSGDDRFVEVKDGDEIDLGGLTLKFFLTPMVHWPETMVTYIPERKTLVSGDAFGCFGALNGAVVDEEMDTSVYWDEMYRYYSNIVGKYGKFVQRALQKLGSLDIEYICTTHGPVWHAEIPRVMDIYNRLSSYASEPGCTIVYGSMYGNTAQIAEAIAQGLAECGVKKIRVHNVATSPMSNIISDAFRYKGLVVGSSTYSMGLMPGVRQLLDAMITREVKDKAFGAFGSFTWAEAPVKKAFEGFAADCSLELAGFVNMKQGIDSEVTQKAIELGHTIALIPGVKE